MDRIEVSEKRLNILLYIISAVVYFLLYFGIYEFISTNFLTIPIEALNIIELIIIFVFILSVVPCCFLIKKLITKFLTK